MRRAVASVVVLVSVVAAYSDDESGRASVRVSAPRTTVYEGEPVELSVDIEYDDAFFREQAVPLFSRKLDVPLRVTAPWINAIRGMERVASPGGPWTTATIAVGDDVENALRGYAGNGGRPGLGVTRTFVAREPAEVTLDAPELRFAYATKFEDDFVDGRRGVDRHDVIVRGQPLVLHVLAVPVEGRPPSFGGAVGQMLSIVANSKLHEVSVGETFRLELTFSGKGHLASFDAPRLDGLAGFHVYGVLDDHDAAVRTIAYDIAALDASVREIPPIEWAYFNTLSSPSYRVLKTTPIPLTVHPAAGTAPAPRATEEGASAQLWAALAAGLTALAAAIAWIVSRRRSAAPDPVDTRHAAAADAVRAAAAGGGDAGAAFTDYLAALLDCAPAAVVGADLAGRLAAAGVPGDFAARAAAAHDALVASRYGGSGAPTAEELAVLVAEIENATARS